MTLFTWSKTAADNDDADGTINFREGQAPSTLNNSGRAMMAAAAKFRDDLSGNLVTGGTDTAYTLTTNQVFTSLTDGLFVRCRLNATNGTAPTLNVDSLGAKAIASIYGTALLAGALLSGGVYDFVYDSTDDKWIVVGFTSAAALGLGTANSPQFTAIELGHASDTTVSRDAAGQIAVEGVRVPTISSTNTLTNKTIALGSNTISGTTAQFNTALSDGDFATLAGTETLANKTLTSPTISGTPVVNGSLRVEATAQASTSGTSIDFSSIPSWVKQITVMLAAVSTNGSSDLLLQLGTGGAATTSGYSSEAVLLGAGGASYQSATNGILLQQDASASDSVNGQILITRCNSSTNLWVATSQLFNGTRMEFGTGRIALAGTIDFVRLTTIGGTATFDAGTVNIQYA